MRGAETALDRDLEDRDLGFGIHQQQRHPGAVVESARLVDIGGESGRAEHIRCARGQFRRARGRIAHVVERLRETEEVVNGLVGHDRVDAGSRSEEHTSELQSLMRISYAVFCLKTQKNRPSRSKLKTTNSN